VWRGLCAKKNESKKNPIGGPSGPPLVSSVGDAEKTAGPREESEGLFSSSTELRKAVVGSLELVGGHEGWNPLWNV